MNYSDERFADLQLLRYRLNGFEQLSLSQKVLVYYLSKATLFGRDITFDQFGKYNLRIRKMLEMVYTDLRIPHDTDEFRALEIGVRRKLFHAMTAFARTLPLVCRSFCVDKRYCTSPETIVRSLVGQLNDYVTAHYDDLSKYTHIKIYYDNGQSQVKEILRQVFATLPAEFQVNVTPERYRLFQVADLICTFRLLKAKREARIPLSKSEEYFFFGARALYKNYLHPLARLLG